MKNLLFFLCFTGVVSVTAQTTTSIPAFPPDSVTARMDRDQILQQLGITLPGLPSVWEDPNRPSHIKPMEKEDPQNPHRWTDDTGYLPDSPSDYLLINRAETGLWLNYRKDPLYTGIYTPLHLLRTNTGKDITTAGEWKEKRYPELMQQCKREIWGEVPAAASGLQVNWSREYVNTTDTVYGRYEKYILTGEVDTSLWPQVKNKPVIYGELYLPEGKEDVSVIIQYAWFRFPAHPVYLEECISRGWGFFRMDCTALQPDNGAYLTAYLIGLVNQGNWRKPSDWGTLAAWGWGVSRLLDYFDTWERTDATRTGITGHSRYGKASLVTMAYDPRITVAYISCSDAGGAAPIRRHLAQDLESLLIPGEFHWLAGNFMKWCGPLREGEYMPRKCEELPVDASALLALCAPRKVFITGGTEDSWCDAYGMYLTCRDASPVYEILGVKGLVMEDEVPVPETHYMEGNVAYCNHIGGHVDFLDWPAFAAWAEDVFKK